MKTAPRRTLMSFSVLFLGLFLFVAAWAYVSHTPEDEGAAPRLMPVLEMNGRLWKKLFNPAAKTVCEAPPKGKKPRVNGRIGLDKPVDAETWRLEVITDDQNPEARRFKVSLKDLLALPRTATATELRCIEGWSEEMAAAGVRFSDFLRAYNLEQKPYVGLRTVDGEYYVSVDIESMLHEQTLLAYEMNGLPLAHLNGAPLRLSIPVKYGIKHLKQIGTIFFSDVRPPDYWAEQGYDWYAGL